MWEFFHSKTVQALGSWLGILTTAFTVLSKLSPAWLGTLTWPEAILLGIGLALATSLLLAIALLVGGLGYRFIRPLPTEAKTPNRPKTGAAAYDDTKLREETADLSKTVKAVIQDYQTVLAKLAQAEERHDALDKALHDEFAEHKEHMSKCYTAQDEARRKGLDALGVELGEIRRGCAKLEETIKEDEATTRESINAVIVKPELAALADEIERSGDDLFLPLKNGETYDRERWGSWQSTHTLWEQTVNDWADKARWYGKNIRADIFHVDDKEYDQTAWGVEDAQFPDADAVRRYKRHRIIQGHWRAARNIVDKNVLAVAYGVLSEKECHGGKHH